MTDYRDAAMKSKAWPFEEARKLLKRYRGERGAPAPKPGGEPMLFETGYGPSGLPHIGTFNEVLRTTMVRRAYETLTGESDTPDRIQRRYGRLPQGADQCSQSGYAGRTFAQTADAGAGPVRKI